MDFYENEIKKEKYELVQLKYEHFCFDDGENTGNDPVSVSVELISEYDFEEEKKNWKRVISFNFRNEEKNSKVEEPISEDLIKELEKVDLRELKNNYYTDNKPESFSRWELTYNHLFKIVGTYDYWIEDINTIRKLLNIEEIVGDNLWN